MNSPKRLAVSSAHTTPTGFYSKRLWDSISWHQNPGLHVLAWGWNCLLPSCPSQFLSTCECGIARFTSCLITYPLYPNCPSLPLLPIWMNVSSLTPWLMDFHTVQFSGSSGFFVVIVFWLVAILLMVVQGGEAYLSTPPSWLEVWLHLWMTKKTTRSYQLHTSKAPGIIGLSVESL